MIKIFVLGSAVIGAVADFPVVHVGSDATVYGQSAFRQQGWFSGGSDNGPWSAQVDYGDGSGPQPLAHVGYGGLRFFLLDHTYDADVDRADTESLEQCLNDCIL